MIKHPKSVFLYISLKVFNPFCISKDDNGSRVNESNKIVNTSANLDLFVYRSVKLNIIEIPYTNNRKEVVARETFA
ncbi:MAG: hypothetical protein N3A71_00625 [Candidatus Dojkabacteria bacterium]|nr:hypothetical protein [Candidatus Dojkabacteria bacterium]